MKVFSLLSHRELFRTEPSEAQVLELLRGISSKALTQYAANICHYQAVMGAADIPVEKLAEQSGWFLKEFAPSHFATIIENETSWKFIYRKTLWVIADQHRVANLVAAFARGNPSVHEGEESPDQIERLVRAQLMVNDLTAPPDLHSTEPIQSFPAEQILHTYAMSRGWTPDRTLPRAYELFIKRLGAANPEFLAAVEKRCGFSLLAVLSSLHAVSARDFLALAARPKINEIPFSRGIIDLKHFEPTHSGGMAFERVVRQYSSSWNDLHEEFSKGDLDNRAVRYFLARPFIQLGEGQFWCFDPGLTGVAASNGLLWLVRSALEDPVSEAQRLFRSVGKVYEDYVADLLFSAHPQCGIERGDSLGKGMPDFLVWEGRTLIAIEAKASTMPEEVKWSASGEILVAELATKILRENQLGNAITRYTQHLKRTSRPLPESVVPVYVVLDHNFVSPGIEDIVRGSFEHPVNIGFQTSDPHVISIGDLEAAVGYVRIEQLTALLDARQQVSSFERSPLGHFISQQEGLIRKHCGTWVPSESPLEDIRREMLDRIKDFFIPDRPVQ